MNHEAMCPVCKKKFAEHSELQDKICEMITIKQFANDSTGFDIQFRPFFEEDYVYNTFRYMFALENYLEIYNSTFIE
ncbi:MAG: hypothetical protein ICV56_05560 [Nitrososphaeraceae archaeon]|nr:hypothetical protein [Nitrososphaeraceae archaeon]